MTVGDQAPENNPQVAGEEPLRLLAGAIIAACVLGGALRAVHLDIPMRYDESVTYLAYAANGWEYVTANYQQPNNHILHSLLVAWLTGWLGADPLTIRLPAFLAGAALVPAAAVLALRLHGREAALLTAAVVATSPLLIEFSTNARGYSLVSLAVVLAAVAGLRLLRSAAWVAWLAWVELGVIAVYAIPAAAIPWLGLTVWLAWGLVERADRGRRLRSLVPLALATGVIGLVSLALYSGILVGAGTEALIGNPYVAAEAPLDVVAATPGEVARIAGAWARGVPLPLVTVLIVCLLAGLFSSPGRETRRLLAALAAGALVSMLVVRNWGEPRIWQWALPLLAVGAAIGAVELARRAPWRAPFLGPIVLGLLWVVLMSGHIVRADPVRASVDTGAAPQVPELFAGMAPLVREGDMVLGDFVNGEPLRYYLDRWVTEHDLLPATDTQRAWIVFDAADPDRSEDVERLVASLGAPALGEMSPVVTAGTLSLYLLGRPRQAPPPPE